MSNYGVLILFSLLVSTNFFAGKVLASVPPFYLTTARYIVATLVFSVIMLRGRLPRVPRRQWLNLVGMGVTGVFLYNPLLYWGLKYTTTISATMINSLNPLLVALLSHFWLREAVERRQFKGLAVSLLGIGWITTRGHISNLFTLSFNPGDLLVLLAAPAWAVYTVLIRKTARDLSPLHSTALASYIGLAFLFPATAVESQWWPSPHLNLKLVLWFVYMGVVLSFLALFLWNIGVAKVGPTTAGIFYNLIPVFNIFLAIPVLHEHLFAYDLIGGCLVIGGIIWATGRVGARPLRT